MGDINTSSSQNENIDPESDFEDIINQIDNGEDSEEEDTEGELNIGGGFGEDIDVDIGVEE